LVLALPALLVLLPGVKRTKDTLQPDS